MNEEKLISIEKMPAFKKAYELAKEMDKEFFAFEGNKVFTKYARYVVELYNNTIREINKKDTDIIRISAKKLADQLAKEFTRDGLVKSGIIEENDEIPNYKEMQPVMKEVYENWYDYFYDIIIKTEIK